MVWRGSQRVRISDRERTLVDGLNSPAWLGGGRNLADAVVTYFHSPHANIQKFLTAMPDFGRGAAFNRLGVLAELLTLGNETLIFAARQGRSRGIIKLDPAVKRMGKLHSFWHVRVNINVTST